jgi:hypothetical protein
MLFAYPECSLPAGIGFGRSVLAHISRPHERQSMELRFVPVRIGNITNLLGPARDGPVHTTHRRIWRAVRGMSMVRHRAGCSNKGCGGNIYRSI